MATETFVFESDLDDRWVGRGVLQSGARRRKEEVAPRSRINLMRGSIECYTFQSDSTSKKSDSTSKIAWSAVVVFARPKELSLIHI